MSCIVDILCVFLIVYHQTSKQRSRCYINKELVAVGRIPSIFKELPVELRDEGQVTSWTRMKKGTKQLITTGKLMGGTRTFKKSEQVKFDWNEKHKEMISRKGNKHNKLFDGCARERNVDCDGTRRWGKHPAGRFRAGGRAINCSVHQRSSLLCACA